MKAGWEGAKRLPLKSSAEQDWVCSRQYGCSRRMSNLNGLAFQQLLEGVPAGAEVGLPGLHGAHDLLFIALLDEA